MYEECYELFDCSCRPNVDVCDFDAVVPTPALQKHLNRQQIRRIEHLHAELIEVEPLPLQGWIFSIAIEPDPEREIRIFEAGLRVFNMIDASANLILEQRRKLFEEILMIMADHACVDPQTDISSELPERAAISDMCRQARESYATWCHS